MSSITFKIGHNKTSYEAKTQIQEQLRKISDEIGIKTKWNNYTCTISGLVKGTINIVPNFVEVEINLRLSARLLKSKIKQKIQKGFQKVLR